MTVEEKEKDKSWDTQALAIAGASLIGIAALCGYFLAGGGNSEALQVARDALLVMGSLATGKAISRG